MSILNEGDIVGIVACSNGINMSFSGNVIKLKSVLEEIGLKVELSNFIYKKDEIFSGTGKERADELMKFFIDDNIKAIFDISGGDVSNGILEYLDYEVIKNNNKPFFGYSDLSVVLNAINSLSDIDTYLYQIKNLIWENGEMQIKRFKESILNDLDSLFKLNYKYVQGQGPIEGRVIGGNIRCFLKLAGTKYFPDTNGKILLLESMGGDIAKMYTYLIQLKQLGVFDNVKGIILGTFCDIEKSYKKEILKDVMMKIIDNDDLPIIETNEIGHNSDSKCVIIGKKVILK